MREKTGRGENVRRNARLLLMRLLAVAAVSGTVAIGGGVAGAQGPYHVADTWKIGGDGGWDYLAVDPQSKLLYVTRGNHVMVIDTASGKVAADITGLKGTHGVVFDTAGKFGYISDGAANEVVAFDRKTNSIVQHIPAGTNPDGMVFEPV